MAFVALTKPRKTCSTIGCWVDNSHVCSVPIAFIGLYACRVVQTRKVLAELVTFSVVLKGRKGPDNTDCRQGKGTPQGGRGGISARYRGSQLQEEDENERVINFSDGRACMRDNESVPARCAVNEEGTRRVGVRPRMWFLFVQHYARNKIKGKRAHGPHLPKYGTFSVG